MATKMANNMKGNTNRINTYCSQDRKAQVLTLCDLYSLKQSDFFAILIDNAPEILSKHYSEVSSNAA